MKLFHASTCKSYGKLFRGARVPNPMALETSLTYQKSVMGSQDSLNSKEDITVRYFGDLKCEV